GAYKDDYEDYDKRERRRIGLHEKVNLYWANQTLQAHHIIEDNIVRDLGARISPFTRNEAPCVLLAADFHQGYFRFVNERASDDTKNVNMKSKLRTGLDTVSGQNLGQLIDHLKEIIKQVYVGMMEPLIPIANAELEAIEKIAKVNL